MLSVCFATGMWQNKQRMLGRWWEKVIGWTWEGWLLEWSRKADMMGLMKVLIVFTILNVKCGNMSPLRKPQFLEIKISRHLMKALQGENMQYSRICTPPPSDNMLSTMNRLKVLNFLRHSDFPSWSLAVCGWHGYQPTSSAVLRSRPRKDAITAKRTRWRRRTKEQQKRFLLRRLGVKSHVNSIMGSLQRRLFSVPDN